MVSRICIPLSHGLQVAVRQSAEGEQVDAVDDLCRHFFYITTMTIMISKCGVDDNADGYCMSAVSPTEQTW